MTVTVRPGTRLFSAVDGAEFITVKAPSEPLELTIGGAAPALSADDRTEGLTVADGHQGGALIGKRYTDEANTIELLCTKPGEALPAVAGTLLTIKDAKPLPASD